MATRNQRRQAHQKPEEKPKDDAGSTAVAEPGNQEAPAPEPEKPDYAPLEAMAGEGAANSEEYTPGSGPEPKAPTVGGKELAGLFQMVYGTLAIRLGAHWQLSDDEAGQLGGATDAVLEKYGAKKAMGPEFTLIVTAGVVTLPRVVLTMAANSDQKPEETGSKTEAGEGAGDGGK
ncbi:MAG TPA: hypothetical protein DD411_06250 [Alcanivorax sp.]|jgi:hypothetical protein|nr:hypothetical protein [Alcanivorax sp.]|tara:strand:+ start:4053 stop:4577 length:525 start_codon:yes stop_codon:yes gene_type:complete